MAFSNTVFPRTPLHNEVTGEEPSLFHAIDRMLVRKLIRGLNHASNDAIDVVAFLLWLERDKLSANAVYKVLTEWPDHLVGMLAEQVVALLEWLKNDVLVWERRGDISLIQELCHEVVSFINLHQRRFEVMEGKDHIKSEMAERAFRETFPGESENRNVQDHVGLGIGAGVRVENSDGGVGYDSRNIVNRNNIRFGVPNVAGGSIYNPRGPRSFGVQLAAPQLQNITLGRAGCNASRRYIPDPRRVMNENRYGVGYNDFRAMPNIGVRSAPGSPVHQVPQTVHRFIPHTLSAINQNLPRCGTMDINDGGSAMEPSMNNVPYGPRMGYVDTNGQIQRSDQVNTRNPIPESELAVLLRGLDMKDEEPDVDEDDRTVFLTFSRGYPLTESDIWGFFTRRFGNFIKAIHIEEVAEGVQPLYARLVARNSSVLPLICDMDANVRTKYVINGKHVWAKRYTRKKNVSSSASTSQQPDHEAS